MSAPGPQVMLPQRQAGPPGPPGFQNMSSSRGSTPSGKRPQDSRGPMSGSSAQKRYFRQI